MKRIKMKKQIYFVVFDRIELKNEKTFHDSFNAHFDANDYYQKKFSQQIFQKNFNIKIHKNDLSFEFQHYNDFKKHFHINDFKQIMRIEL